MATEFEIALMIGIGDPDKPEVIAKHRAELDRGATSIRPDAKFVSEEINAYIVRQKDFRTGKISVLHDPAFDGFKILRRRYS